MESMLSSLNINQKDLPLSEIEKQTVVQVHNQSETETILADIVPLAKQIYSEFSTENNNLEQFDDEYVTIKDVKAKPNAYPFNKIIDDNLDKILSGSLNLKTEYVSLNELPCNANHNENICTNGKNTKLIAGTNVNLKPNEMFVYDSSTLRYKRSLCTTFKTPTAAENVKPSENANATLNQANQQQETEANDEITSDDKRSSSTSSSPFEKMASDSDSTAGLDDVYVTLSTDKRDMNTKNIIATKSLGSVSDPELSDSSKDRDTMSLTWPLTEQAPKVPKRRFSWENIAKSAKESKLSKLKRRRDKFSWLTQSKEKKSPTKAKSTFKTSTPLKNGANIESSSVRNIRESSFGNSTAISHVGNKSNEPQQTTCSDRLGTPKTSLNDFKKLLLNATNKRLSNVKPSAVEQLKLRQESIANASPMKILDLSASPKSFTNRRILQQTTSSSPYKKSNLMSPRSRWRGNNFNKTPISSIPEANAEDEQTANEIKPTENQSNTPIYATPRKNPIPLVAASSNKSSDITSTKTTIAPIIAKTESSPETGVIETDFSLDENIFLLAEENNFMKGEVRPFASKSASKSSALETTKPSVDKSDTAESRALETSF